MDFLRKPVSLFRFSLVVSIATLLLYNIPFFNYGNFNGKIVEMLTAAVLKINMNQAG